MTETDIRQYQSGDRDALLALHDAVFGDGHGPEWFDWKFVDQPVLDHVPIVVADRDGTLVGARPCLAMRMAVDGETHVALQPCDTMVHPDHRRQGLFTRMTERTLDRYADGEPRFLFNFPNEHSAGGYLDMGWRRVGPRTLGYRIAAPGRVLAAETGRATLGTAGRLAGPLLDGYDRVRRALGPAPASVSVRGEPGVPAATLAALAGDATDPVVGVHAVRDEAFYRWRFDAPGREYATYVASDGDGPVAALVVGRRVGEKLETVDVTEVVPLAGASIPVLRALLDRVVADYADADMFVAPTDSLPASLLGAFGFATDDAVPLSWFASPTNHVVRTLGDWSASPATDLTEPAAWTMSLAERDTY